MKRQVISVCLALSLTGSALAATASAVPSVSPSSQSAQRGGGQPYEIIGSEVWDVPDPVSARDYQVFVALPAGYAENPQRRYPVLYVTDADYAFPLIRQMARRMNVEGPRIEDFILVGLSYAKGEGGMPSRRRDYTPTPNAPSGTPADAVHGGGAAYLSYLDKQVLPFIAQHYRTDEQRRLLLGHSYGALLGTQILFERPQMFAGYILGSPSYWYDQHVMERQEGRFAVAHRDLPARVYMYVGEREAVAHGADADMVKDAQRMQKALASRKYASLQLQLDVLNDEDHLTVAPRGFMQGLEYLLAQPATTR